MISVGPSGAQDADPSARGISVVGNGSVSVFPDSARITLGVKAVDATVARAKTTVDKAVSGILQACSELSIERTAVTATELTISPEYDYDSDRPKLKGYEVARSVEVSLTHLESFNDLIQRSLDAGANDIDAIELESSKERDLTLQALSKAIQNAKEQAEHIARELGKQLGEVRSASTQQANRTVMYSPSIVTETVRVSGASARGAAEFRPGPIEVSAVVFVNFSFK